MKIKKLVSMVLVLAMAFVMALPASAASDDTAFKFKFNGSGSEIVDGNGSRAKGNDTSCYIHYISGPSSVIVKIYGTYTYGTIERNGNWYKGLYDCITSVYTIPRVPVGKRGFIRQLVKERGYPYAIMSGMGISQNVACTGKWSPDSVAEAGVYDLNS